MYQSPIITASPFLSLAMSYQQPHVVIGSADGLVSYFESVICSKNTFHELSDKINITLLTPSFGNHLFAYHLVLKHPHTNMILSSFCIPNVVKSATKILKMGS